MRISGIDNIRRLFYSIGFRVKKNGVMADIK